MIDLQGNLCKDSDMAHQRDILIAHKGHFKFSPEVGVGITDLIQEDAYTPMLIEIKRQMQHDGMVVKNVFINPQNKLVIDGYYQESR